VLDLEQPPGWKTAAVVSSGRHRASTADVVLYEEEEQHIGVHAHEFTGGISCVHDGGLWHLVCAAAEISFCTVSVGCGASAGTAPSVLTALGHSEVFPDPFGMHLHRRNGTGRPRRAAAVGYLVHHSQYPFPTL
jgi:hypothetical protein